MFNHPLQQLVGLACHSNCGQIEHQLTLSILLLITYSAELEPLIVTSAVCVWITKKYIFLFFFKSGMFIHLTFRTTNQDELKAERLASHYLDLSQVCL